MINQEAMSYRGSRRGVFGASIHSKRFGLSGWVSAPAWFGSHLCLKRFASRVLMVLAAFVLIVTTGCVTETSGGRAKKNKDMDRFIDTSVSAAVRYMREGQTDDAFRHLNRALEADKKNSRVHGTLALLYRMTGDTELEERHFKLAIRYNPDDPKVRNNYSTFLYREGRYKDALAQLKKAVKDPSYSQRELALYNMGRCYLKLEKPDRAVESFERAVRLKDELPEAHFHLAVLHEEAGRLRKSNAHLEAFGRYARHTPKSLWLGIRLQREIGNRDALASYELALRNLYPDSEEYRLYTESKRDNN